MCNRVAGVKGDSLSLFLRVDNNFATNVNITQLFLLILLESASNSGVHGTLLAGANGQGNLFNFKQMRA